jgi:BlaI family transcriptional regulator, penicillinase repressor
MPRPVSEHPTGLELQILKVLWDDSPLPVRDIRQRLAEQGRELAHTSVITTLNIMVRKKYLRRSRRKNAYLFQPRVAREQVAEGMLGDLVDRVFDGSAASVMLSLFNVSDIDQDELKELRRLIQQKSREQSQ